MDILNEKSFLNYENCSSKPELNKEFLNKRLQFYTYENEKAERALKLLHILEDDGTICSPHIAEVVGKLADVQEKFGVDSFNPTAMSMVHADHMYNTKDTCGKLQKCVKIQNHVSTEINEKSKVVERALVKAKKQLNDLKVSPEEIKALQDQLSTYETEIKRYEGRYPWLKDPNFDLLAIMDKIDDLKVLKNKEMKLSEAVDQYKGLKPNLAEADEQLLKLKQEYENINVNIFKML